VQRVVALELDDGTVWQVVDPPSLGLSTGAVEVRLHTGELLRLRRFGGWVSGKVERPGAVPVLFRVNPAGVCRWRVADRRGALPCATGPTERVLTGQGDGPVPPPRQLGAEDGSRIDTLALYTPDARASAGSSEAMQADMLRWFDETNAVLADSGVSTSVLVVGMLEVDSNASGDASIDRASLLGTSDGVWDSIHAVRDERGADMVVLFVEQMDGNCGIGGMITQAGGNASNAFAVVKNTCAESWHTLTHEFGHIQGCAHDAENAGVAGIDDRAYGWSFEGAGFPCNASRFCTVMAYQGVVDMNDCPGPGDVTSVNTFRIGLLSTPLVTHQGTPVGDAVVADNTAVWGERRVITARYRPRVVGSVCPGDLDGSGAVDVVDLITVLGTWGAAAAGSQIDINADGVVDILDIAVILDRYGGC